MRADIVASAVFPDYELTDHTGKRRSFGPTGANQAWCGYCPKDLRQAAGQHAIRMK